MVQVYIHIYKITYGIKIVLPIRVATVHYGSQHTGHLRADGKWTNAAIGLAKRSTRWRILRTQ